MEKVLNQDEIDAMFRAALGRGHATQSSAPVYQPCDFKQAGQIKKDQVRAIGNLHEGFARNLTNALGAYLRVVFEGKPGFPSSSSPFASFFCVFQISPISRPFRLSPWERRPC